MGACWGASWVYIYIYIPTVHTHKRADRRSPGRDIYFERERDSVSVCVCACVSIVYIYIYICNRYMHAHAHTKATHRWSACSRRAPRAPISCCTHARVYVVVIIIMYIWLSHTSRWLLLLLLPSPPSGIDDAPSTCLRILLRACVLFYNMQI